MQPRLDWLYPFGTAVAMQYLGVDSNLSPSDLRPPLASGAPKSRSRTMMFVVTCTPASRHSLTAALSRAKPLLPRTPTLAHYARCHGPRLYVCQAPNAFICVSSVALPNTKCVYMCVTKCVYVCVTKCVHMCVTKSVHMCVTNSQRSSLRSLTFARFARTLL